MTLQPTLLGRDDEVRVYARDTAVVVVPNSDTGFDETRAFIQQRHAELGARIGVVVLVRPGIEGDALRIRESTQTFLAEASDALACMAYAIDGRGFFASRFMSVASGIFLHLRGTTTPMRACASAADAADWVAMHLGDAPWVGPFVESVREQL
ncbi:MAG: hypothetical protein ACRBN8_02810 [Nannocystales bacterium]